MKTIKTILRYLFIAISFLWIAFIIAYSIVGSCDTATIISDNTENTYSIPVQSPRAHISGFKNVYSVPVSFKKGDIVMVNGQVEVTTELPFVVMYGSFLALGETPYDFTNTFSKAQGTNITRTQHHYSEKISASKMIEQDFDGYMIFVVYSASTKGKGTIKVEKGYGNMSVVIMR